MFTKRMILIVLMLLIATLSACAPNTPAATLPPGGIDQLVEDLKGAGAQVTLGDTVEQPFFSTPGRIIQVNGMDIMIFEFADEAAQQAATATISAGGFIIGTSSVDWIDTPHFWAKDRMIVLYVGQNQAQIDLLGGLLGEPVNAQPPSGGMGPSDQAPFALAAKAALSQKLGISAGEVTFVSAEPVEWSDSCLGLGGPAELCALMMTPGHNVILNAQGTDYEVHTDESGSVVRIKE